MGSKGFSRDRDNWLRELAMGGNGGNGERNFKR